MVDPWTLSAAFICGAICMRIVSFRRDGARYRPGVSMLAYALAVGTGCYALSVALAKLYGHAVEPVSPFLLIVLATVLVLVYKHKGNVASLLSAGWGSAWDGQERRHAHK